MTAPADSWGPWAPDLDRAERVARLRSMRSIVRLSTGPRGAELCALLRQAETDPEAALELAALALGRLAALDFRRVLSTFAEIHRPAPVTSRSR